MESEAPIYISICDWKKFNPRKDRKTHSWFRVENTFFRKTRKWGKTLRLFFLYLCAERSFNQDKEVFAFDLEDQEYFLGISKEEALNLLNLLSNTGKIQIYSDQSGNQLVTSVTPTGSPTYVRTNVRSSRENTATNQAEKKEESKTESNPLKVFEAQFDGPMVKKYWSALETVLGNVSPSLKRAIPKMIIAFGDYDTFKQKVEDLWNNKKVSPEKDRPGFRRYFETALLREVGVLSEKRAQ